MSRWLQNVGNFLEQLDEKAEKAVEGDVDFEIEDLPHHEEEDALLQSEPDAPTVVHADPDESETTAPNAPALIRNNDDILILEEPVHSKRNVVEEQQSRSVPTFDASETVATANTEPSSTTPSTRPNKPQETPFLTPAQTDDMDSTVTQLPVNDATTTATNPESDSLQHVVQSLTLELERLKAEHSKTLANNSKESKTLRRHLAKLNEQVKAADTELEHQRRELEEAATRLEKDRKLFKEKMQKCERDKKDALQALKQSHEATLMETKEQYEQEVYQVQQQLESLHHQRQLEGGESDNLIMDAQARESDLLREVDFLQQEKETLLSQVETLQKNQESLGSRLESLMETADAATIRERQAEERLDEALELHGKQVTQRQQREAQLEQRLAELTAALVAERNKQQQQVQVPGDETAQTSEVQSLQNVVDQERQQQVLLRNQLHDLSKERTEEAEVAQKRVQRLERKITALEEQIDTLQTAPPTIVKEEADPELFKRIKNLSEEVVAQRHKITSANSEITALRTRLSVALNRATVAEAAAESNDTVVRRQPVRTKRTMPSLPSALGIHSPMLDAVDSVLSRTGKLLRVNPFARLFFVLYMVVLHLWTLALLFFHAHNFDTLHDIHTTIGHGPTAVAQGNLRGAGGG